MSSKSPSGSAVASSGISTGGLLGVLFVGLKLTGYISWPWVWVLAPFWLPLAILLAILGLIALVLFCSAVVDGILIAIRNN